MTDALTVGHYSQDGNHPQSSRPYPITNVLFASTAKGNRPSYSKSARPEIAVPIYEQFIAKLTADMGKPIQTGEFGADMKVSLLNDGQ